MELPKNCPACKEETLWLIRAEPDFDINREGDRIEDSIIECDKCHTLFRVRWKMISMNLLIEGRNYGEK